MLEASIFYLLAVPNGEAAVLWQGWVLALARFIAMAAKFRGVEVSNDSGAHKGWGLAANASPQHCETVHAAASALLASWRLAHSLA